MSKSNTRRLLAALLIPTEAVRTWQTLLPEGLPLHDLSDPASTWLTVHFIGDTPTRDVDDVLESVERSVSGVRGFQLTPRRVATIPVDQPAKQVVVQFDLPPSLREIKDRLVRRLARGRKKTADAFEPRVTLARMKEPTVGLELDIPVSSPVISVAEVFAVRSVLLPNRYENRVVESHSL